MHKWLLIGISLTLLTGFNSFGPINQSEYKDQAKAQLPVDAGHILVLEPGAWAINANGFTDIRSQQTPLLGVLLVTTKAIYFQQWIEAEQRYDTMLSISLRDIATIREETFGRSVRIVVKKTDLTVTSLSVMSGSGGAIDREKTHEWLELLRTKIGAG